MREVPKRTSVSGIYVVLLGIASVLMWGGLIYGVAALT
jgi:hypothetical protein